jgi:hypothetical protein
MRKTLANQADSLINNLEDSELNKNLAVLSEIAKNKSTKIRDNIYDSLSQIFLELIEVNKALGKALRVKVAENKQLKAEIALLRKKIK